MVEGFFRWLAGLQGFELVLWVITLFFSLLFFLQTLVSVLFGGDGDHDHHDGDSGHSYFTIKNLIAFFTMFGWTGLAAYHGGLGKGASVAVATGAGVAIVVVMITLLRHTAKLKHSGTLEMKNALNQVGETYLRIPASRGGIGKIHVQVQGRLVELDAMTDDGSDIATGRPIQVTHVLSNQLLLVTSHLNSQPS